MHSWRVSMSWCLKHVNLQPSPNYSYSDELFTLTDGQVVAGRWRCVHMKMQDNTNIQPCRIALDIQLITF